MTTNPPPQSLIPHDAFVPNDGTVPTPEDMYKWIYYTYMCIINHRLGLRQCAEVVPHEFRVV